MGPGWDIGDLGRQDTQFVILGVCRSDLLAGLLLFLPPVASGVLPGTGEAGVEQSLGASDGLACLVSFLSTTVTLIPVPLFLLEEEGGERALSSIFLFLALHSLLRPRSSGLLGFPVNSSAFNSCQTFDWIPLPPMFSKIS